MAHITSGPPVVKKGLKPSQIYLNEILEGEDLIPKEYADYFRNFVVTKLRSKDWNEVFLIQSTTIENSREHQSLKFIRVMD